MPNPYYKDVLRQTRLAAVVFCILGIAACDRGHKPPAIGAAAPGFTVTDAVRTVSLDQFRGQTVVLNFWASWCQPCVEEMPSLVAMQRQLKDRGVTVLAVSTDEDDAAYRRFLNDHHIDLLTVRDGDKRSSSLYGTWRWPETYVIDSKGMVRRKFIGPVDWTTPEIIEYLTRLDQRERDARNAAALTAPPSATAANSRSPKPN
jgi:cytochrome c biogenesis protein CcmG, thiol:disulfide interchange protein DsbE